GFDSSVSDRFSRLPVIPNKPICHRLNKKLPTRSCRAAFQLKNLDNITFQGFFFFVDLIDPAIKT
ncbi:MAG: hypothetical protein FWE82_08420, partial [Defluviitaleaceae bacterium]|nr:hypothetical protein [Defluviitaleaceae bacterium]